MGRGRSDRTKRIVALAHQVLESEHPMTLRQLFYRLVSVRALENRQADYQGLSRILTGARKREEIPYEWITDRSRPVYEANAFKNPAGYAEAVKRSYRRDYWQDQPWHVEVWTEKDAVVGAIQPVTDEYGITVRTGRGFQSTTRVHEIAELFKRLEDDGKQILVLYLGDHDPSGECMEREGASRVREQIDDASGFAAACRAVGLTIERTRELLAVTDACKALPVKLRQAVDAGTMDHERALKRAKMWPIVVPEAYFSIRRLAIHQEDIGGFNLPPLRIKTSDSRARGFLARHGADCVELDALPPTELRDRLREAIEERIDRPKWERAIAVEKVELESIRKLAGEIGNLWAGDQA